MTYIKVILISVVVIFVTWFVIGIIAAAVLGRKKHRNVYAINLLSKVPPRTIEHLVKLLNAHKNSNTEEVNQIIFSIGSHELQQLLTLLGSQTRPIEFSSGKFGNELAWTVMERALQERGYTVHASKLVAGIIFHNIDEILPNLKK